MHGLAAICLSNEKAGKNRPPLQYALGLHDDDRVEIECGDRSCMRLRLRDLIGVEFEITGPDGAWIDWRRIDEAPASWSQLDGDARSFLAKQRPNLAHSLGECVRSSTGVLAGGLIDRRPNAGPREGLWHIAMKRGHASFAGHMGSPPGERRELGPDDLLTGFTFDPGKGRLELEGVTLFKVEIRLGGELLDFLRPYVALEGSDLLTEPNEHLPKQEAIVQEMLTLAGGRPLTEHHYAWIVDSILWPSLDPTTRKQKIRSLASAHRRARRETNKPANSPTN
jgi:hypothetical protein